MSSWDRGHFLWSEQVECMEENGNINEHDSNEMCARANDSRMAFTSASRKIHTKKFLSLLFALFLSFCLFLAIMLTNIMMIDELESMIISFNVFDVLFLSLSLSPSSFSCNHVSVRAHQRVTFIASNVMHHYEVVATAVTQTAHNRIELQWKKNQSDWWNGWQWLYCTAPKCIDNDYSSDLETHTNIQ